MYNPLLDTFKAVADARSFSRAAEMRYISHTAVIKQINALEAHLGVKLFRRSNHGVVLTSAGQTLYDKTLEIMRFSDAAIAEIQAAHFAAPKTIRVGTSLFYPCHIFMDLWDRISDRCPRYQLKVVPIGDDEQRFAGLGRDYDFIVGAYDSALAGQAFPFYPIGSYHFCIAMPRKHPLAHRDRLQPADLAGARLMMMHPGHSAANDALRAELLRAAPDLTLIDTAPHYSTRTFNDCITQNALLLSLECWQDVHPALVSVPLETSQQVPYGIVAAKSPTPDTARFIQILQDTLAQSPQ